MDSIDEFRARMHEIDILIEYAKHNMRKIETYQMFIKAAITFMISKFEVFIEEFVEEHSKKMLRGHTNRSFPIDLKNQYIAKAIAIASEKKGNVKKEQVIRDIVCLYDGSRTVSLTQLMNVRPKLSFSLGKHGQKEVESMFEAHGLGTFLADQEVKDRLNSLNSLIAIRHNIIHQDSTPHITHQDVKRYQESMKKFVDLLEVHIEENSLRYYNL